jgi:hypothetical protein
MQLKLTLQHLKNLSLKLIAKSTQIFKIKKCFNQDLNTFKTKKKIKINIYLNLNKNIKIIKISLIQNLKIIKNKYSKIKITIKT